MAGSTPLFIACDSLRLDVATLAFIHAGADSNIDYICAELGLTKLQSRNISRCEEKAKLNCLHELCGLKKRRSISY